MNENSWLNKLKNRWQVNSIFQVILILIVFACTGFSVIGIKHLIGIDASTSTNVRILFYVLIFPVYNIMLLAYGFIFGQFKFFFNFEKRFFSRIVQLFKSKK